MLADFLASTNAIKLGIEKQYYYPNMAIDTATNYELGVINDLIEKYSKAHNEDMDETINSEILPRVMYMYINDECLGQLCWCYELVDLIHSFRFRKYYYALDENAEPRYVDEVMLTELALYTDITMDELFAGKEVGIE